MFNCCFHLQDVVIVGEALQLLVLCLQLRTQLMGETTFCAINATLLVHVMADILRTRRINIYVTFIKGECAKLSRESAPLIDLTLIKTFKK